MYSAIAAEYSNNNNNNNNNRPFATIPFIKKDEHFKQLAPVVTVPNTEFLIAATKLKFSLVVFFC